MNYPIFSSTPKTLNTHIRITDGYSHRKIAPSETESLDFTPDDARVIFWPVLTHEALEYLAWFIKDTGFFIEQLEEEIDESLDDFWMAREDAYHIVTDAMLALHDAESVRPS
jgi:hypothetical protein